mgnify:CR=1 FL=1
MHVEKNIEINFCVTRSVNDYLDGNIVESNLEIKLELRSHCETMSRNFELLND